MGAHCSLCGVDLHVFSLARALSSHLVVPSKPCASGESRVTVGPRRASRHLETTDGSECRLTSSVNIVRQRWAMRICTPLFNSFRRRLSIEGADKATSVILIKTYECHREQLCWPRILSGRPLCGHGTPPTDPMNSLASSRSLTSEEASHQQWASRASR